MASLKIAINLGRVPDTRVKLKIEIESNPKPVIFPIAINPDHPWEPGEANPPVINSSQAETPEFMVHSGSFWRKFISWLKGRGSAERRA
jgi:hypothetical protein